MHTWEDVTKNTKTGGEKSRPAEKQDTEMMSCSRTMAPDFLC